LFVQDWVTEDIVLVKGAQVQTGIARTVEFQSAR
jgi:hypothetical protein